MTAVAAPEVEELPQEDVAQEEETQEEVAKFQFDEDFQKKIVTLAVRDPKFVRRVEGLIDPNYFESDANKIIFSLGQQYYDRYRVLPGSAAVWSQILKDAMANKQLRKEEAPEVLAQLKTILKAKVTDADFVADKVGEFAREQAVNLAVIQMLELREKGRHAEAQAVMERAFRVGAHDDFVDIDYWNDIDRRTQYRLDVAAGVIKPNGITTGIKQIDALLYHNGWGRKELSAIMGGAKKGKSTGLGFFSIAASMAGYNVLYATMEVANAIIADRMDAHVSQTDMQDIKNHIHAVKSKVEMKAATSGRGELRLVEFPSGTLTPRGLRRVIERYRSDGIHFDLIVPDYADIMAPDVFTKDPIENSKQIWLGLRAIAYEEDAAVLTATQTNRDGFKASTAKAGDVAEDFNKIRIADLVVSINRDDDERARGEARLYFAASRNQAGEFTINIKQDLAKMTFISGVTGVTK